MEILNEKKIIEKIKNQPKRTKKYFCMYSSWLDGIVQDSQWMFVPIDDHIVHRGDGVFEAIRYCYGKFYDLESHLRRLEKSRKAIGLECPKTNIEIEEILNQMIKLTSTDEAMVRLYLSRGPGGFTTNPYESIGPQLYIVLTEYTHPKNELYEKGAKACFIKEAIKPAPWHEIKSCNYLPNVMMKKYAVDHKIDFTVSISEDGKVAEGSTENFAIILNNKFIAPPFDKTLEGTTLKKLVALAKRQSQELGLSEICYADIYKEDVFSADEIFFIGTTLEVLPVTEFEGKPVGNGQVGPYAKKLRQILQDNMK